MMDDNLIKRLQEAPEGSRELDELIAFHICWRPDNPESKVSFAEHEQKHDYATAWIAHAPWRSTWNIPYYTTSLDAKLPWENIVSIRKQPGGLWCAWHEQNTKPARTYFGSEAHTEPLARRCAALKAKQEQDDGRSQP